MDKDQEFLEYTIKALVEQGQAAEATPAPDLVTVLAGLTGMDERVRRLAQEVFGFYQRLPHYERVRSERWGMPAIAAYAEGEENNRLALTSEALRPFGVEVPHSSKPPPAKRTP